MSSVAAEPPTPTTFADQLLQQQQPPPTTLPSTPTPTPVPSLPDTTTTTTNPPPPAIPTAAVKMTHGSGAAGPAGPLEAGVKGVLPAKGGSPSTKGSSKMGMLYHVTRGQPTNYDMVRVRC